MAADLYEKILSSLRSIDADIIKLNRIKNENDIKTKKRIIVEDLDKIEKIIMKGDWGDDSYKTRLDLRSKIYKLYKKLPYCPPKRSKRQYALHSNEYEDSEAISNRDDLSNCPERDEPFTETDKTRIPQDEMYKEAQNNTDTIDAQALYFYFIEQLKEINSYIDKLPSQSVDEAEYIKRRKDIIKQLDIIEEQIMRNDWGGIYHFYYRTHIRPLLYYLYNKIKYCPPNRLKRHYERKTEKYEKPVENSNREKITNCPAELYTYDDDKDDVYKIIREIQSLINELKKMTKLSSNSDFVQYSVLFSSNTPYGKKVNQIDLLIEDVQKEIENKFWFTEFIPIIDGINILMNYVVNGKSTYQGPVLSIKFYIEKQLSKIRYDINELQKNSYQNGYSNKSIVNIIVDLNDVENMVNKNKWNKEFSETISTLNEKLENIDKKYPSRVHVNNPTSRVHVNNPTTAEQVDDHVVFISIVYINKEDALKLVPKIKTETEKHMSKLSFQYEKIDINDVNESSFQVSDYIIFIFPKSVSQLKSCLSGQPKIEQMIGWIVRLNDTGKCIVLNKPKFKYFEKMKFKFNGNLDTFMNVLFSFNDTNNEIAFRTVKCYTVPWYIWINKKFQKYYKDHINDFINLQKVDIRYFTLEMWVLTLFFSDRRDVVFLENDSEQLYDHRYNFGRSNHYKLIHDMKVYDKKMLHRVHKLREKLKYEMDPKIRRELRIKYNKLKKRIN